ncbi:MAG: hypothetical protein ACJ74U_10395 [Jatrophihabitantaceae bacterium]
MSAATLSQVDGLPLYALSTSIDSGIAGYWAGYLAKSLTGAELTFDQAWQDIGGTFLFLGKAPGTDDGFATFLDLLRPFLAGIAPSGDARLLWIVDATLPSHLWTYHVVSARATGSGERISWATNRSSQLILGEYAVQLAGQAALTQASPPTGIQIADGALSFSAPGRTVPAEPGTSVLALSGPAVGSVRATLTLPTGAGDGLADLRTQLRYAAPAGDGSEGSAIDTLELPVIGQQAAAITLWLRFDPTLPLLAQRTGLGFFDDAGNGTAPVLAGYLNTNLGAGTTLTPSAAGAPLRPARLVFGQTPQAVGSPELVGHTYHLAPDGAFGLAVVGGEQLADQDGLLRVSLGSSAQEYVTFPAAAGAVAFFQAGQPALAPGAAPAAPPSKPGDPLLDAAATTAHVTLLPAQPGAGLPYYAQPRQAPLFASATALKPGSLGYLEMQAGALAARQETTPATVPVGPLLGAAPGDGELAQRIERCALAPARRQQIGLDNRAVGGEPPTPAVTPQGLQVEVVGGLIRTVVLATMPDSTPPALALTGAGPRLRAALQASQLFFVVANPAEYLADSSVRYRLDDLGLVAAADLGIPAAVINSVRPVVMPGGLPKTFEDEHAFTDALAGATPTPPNAQQRMTLCAIGGFLKAVLSGWTFQLSPRSWRTQSNPPKPEFDAPTIMLVKLCNRSLESLAADPPAWSWPAAGGLPTGGIAATQQELARVFAAARRRAEDPTVPPNDPYAAFYRNVVADPAWTGVLFLNAPVALAALPPELQFATAGIDQSRFFAHHIGISTTPVRLCGDTISTQQTAAFGLIDYQDPADQTLDPNDPDRVTFAFKTQAVTARFSNAVLTDFSARVELMVNELFGVGLTKLDPTHGNNLVLNGSAQRTSGAPAYAFELEGMNRFITTRSMLQSIDVDRVRLQTAVGTDRSGQVRTNFVLGGLLRFADLERFDHFGYGPAIGEPPVDGWLAYEGLTVAMSYELGGQAKKSFTIELTSVQLDPSRSQARANALVNRFPVSVTGLIASPADQKPQDLGYVSVSADLDQTPLDPPWFGLVWSLELGTFGALSDGAPVSLQILAGWGPGAADGDRPAYLGLKLPGYGAAGVTWPLQGVMRLGFRSIGFETFEEPSKLDPKVKDRTYILRLRHLALSILGISFPPGELDLVLFGDPTGASRSVGWYAAYVDPNAATPPRLAPQPPRLVPSGQPRELSR